MQHLTHEGSTVHLLGPASLETSIRRDEHAAWGHSVSTVASDRTQPGCTGTPPQTLHQTGDATNRVKGYNLKYIHSSSLSEGRNKKLTITNRKKGFNPCTNTISKWLQNARWLVKKMFT